MKQFGVNEEKQEKNVNMGYEKKCENEQDEEKSVDERNVPK